MLLKKFNLGSEALPKAEQAKETGCKARLTSFPGVARRISFLGLPQALTTRFSGWYISALFFKRESCAVPDGDFVKLNMLKHISMKFMGLYKF